jgi:hypothetical protein
LILRKVQAPEDATLLVSRRMAGPHTFKEIRMTRHFVACCIAFFHKNRQHQGGAAQQHIGLHGTLIEPRK